MSTSRAIKPKRDDTHLTKWESVAERAPSIMRDDRPTVARVMAMVGLFLLVLGILAMLAPRWQRATAISPGVGFLLGSIGLVLILYHAFSERDFQFRRLYGAVGLMLVFGGILLRLIAFNRQYVSYFVLAGLPGLSIGLILLVGVIRNETEPSFRKLVLMAIGGIGGLMILFSVIFGLINADYMPGEGALLMVLGLLYACSFIGLQQAGDDNSYHAGLGLGLIGLIAFGSALIRSLWPESNFLVPSGLILMGLALVYITISLGICADWPIVVIARRELAAYFYSPIAYLVFIGLLIVGWFMFWLFVEKINEYGAQGVMFEPIIGHYIFDIFPVIAVTFVVPALTMRLLSEERRTGTLEVLLTAPVNEISVVLGKFFACWIFYMLLWVPWMLFLVALRYMGGEEFDYRPVLSFTVAMASISAGFLSMGLFFSTITSNQIIAAVLTFVGMIAHLGFYFIKFRIGQGSALFEMLTYINYLDFWLNSLDGILAPRYLVFHLSVAVFFLFLSIKVLESRKWQ